MEIAKLGEFGLIDRLTKDIKIKNDSTKYGVGDDCAVLSYPDKEVLVTTDLLMEGVHFDLTYIDLQHLGYKSAMVNISDVFAMNGTPRQITVSLALSKRFTVEDMELFYSGLRQMGRGHRRRRHHLQLYRSGYLDHLHRRGPERGYRLSQWSQGYRPHLCLRRPRCRLYGTATAGTGESRLLWTD